MIVTVKLFPDNIHLGMWKGDLVYNNNHIHLKKQLTLKQANKLNRLTKSNRYKPHDYFQSFESILRTYGQARKQWKPLFQNRAAILLNEDNQLIDTYLRNTHYLRGSNNINLHSRLIRKLNNDWLNNPLSTITFNNLYDELISKLLFLYGHYNGYMYDNCIEIISPEIDPFTDDLKIFIPHFQKCILPTLNHNTPILSIPTCHNLYNTHPISHQRNTRISLSPYHHNTFTLPFPLFPTLKKK